MNLMLLQVHQKLVIPDKKILTMNDQTISQTNTWYNAYQFKKVDMQSLQVWKGFWPLGSHKVWRNLMHERLHQIHVDLWLIGSLLLRVDSPIW